MTEVRLKLTLAKIREANLARDAEVFQEVGVWSAADWAVAFAGEVGEALNKLKKLRKAHGGHVKWRPGQVTKEDVGEELADALVYMDLLAYCIGIDLEEAYRKKFNRVSRAINSKVRL